MCEFANSKMCRCFASFLKKQGTLRATDCYYIEHSHICTLANFQIKNYGTSCTI